MRPEIVHVRYIQPFEALDEGSVERYYRAGSGAAFLERTVLKMFRESVIEATGYSEGNEFIFPEKPETAILLKGTKFPISVISSPTEKRPPMKEVYLHLIGFLDRVNRDYTSGIQRKGVLTIEGKPYILLDDVWNEIKSKKDEVTGHGIKQEPKFPDLNEDVLGSLEDGVIVNLGDEYWELTEQNGILFARSRRLADYLNKSVITPFEDALKERTGFTKDDPPEEQEDHYELVGSHMFRVSTIPETKPDYNSIITSLVGEKTATGKIGKTTGDFVIIKEEIVDERTAVYDVRTRDGNIFISLENLLNRIESLVEESTKTIIRQPIEHYPALF